MGVIRMNITLPEDVVKILKKKTKTGEKSFYIAEAIRAFAEKESQEEIIHRMIQGYQQESTLTEEDTEWIGSNLSGPKK